MAQSDEELKKTADLKVWLEGKISQLESELAGMNELLSVLNSVLRKASFVPASMVTKPEPSPQLTGFKEVIPIKRGKDGKIIANAYVSEKDVAVVPASDVILSVSTPPFRSFFINRILEGMVAKDKEAASQGKISPGDILSYKVEEADGIIKSITITNYGDRSRLNEINNTISWAFTRMLEKGGG